MKALPAFAGRGKRVYKRTKTFPQAMITVPGTVSTYLHDYAPKGRLIAYWRDASREYSVLVLYRHDGEFRFSVGAFPEVVGHWGHQLEGGDYSLEETQRQLDCGFWGADEPLKERVRTLVARLMNHEDAGDILAECRAVCDPQGRFDPPGPPELHQGPNFRYEGEFRVIAALVQDLRNENHARAEEAVLELATMGISENHGPLFARNALLAWRKRQAGSRRSP